MAPVDASVAGRRSPSPHTSLESPRALANPVYVDAVEKSGGAVTDDVIATENLASRRSMQLNTILGISPHVDAVEYHSQDPAS